MQDFKNRFENFRPLKYNLTFRILMIIIPIVVGLSVIDYYMAKNDLIINFRDSREQAEKSILHSIKMAESAYAMYSSALDDKLKKDFQLFIKSYRDAGGDPSKIDLGALKARLGDNLDLYVIDDKNVVRFSTYETDVGLDFNEYPEFRDYLNQIRYDPGYASQRIMPEIRTGRLRKFAYYSTPGGKWILEIGLVSDKFTDIVNELNYMKIAREMVSDYPYLFQVRVFDMNGYVIGSEGEQAGPGTMRYIKRVVEEKKDLGVSGETEGVSRSFLYVRSRAEEYETASTRVVELVWNKRLMDMELSKKAFSHFAVCVLAILGSVIITLYSASRISRPINEITKDVDRIARGDLDHEITVEVNNELMILEHSINIMVNTIKENMREVRRYSENLERMVEDRTAELEEANEQLEIFVFSITHDLRSPLRKIGVEARELLEKHGDKLDDEARGETRRILKQSDRLDRLIMDLLAYSRLGRAEIKAEKAEPRVVIHEAVARLEDVIEEKDAAVSLKGDFPAVKGHASTLEQVFSNLISNALKYSKEGVPPELNVYSEARNGFVRIYFEDNGIGIKGEYREKIFRLFERLHSEDEYPGTGLGLAIVKKGVEKMGGRVGLESKEGEGSRFWIDLPRA